MYWKDLSGSITKWNQFFGHLVIPLENFSTSKIRVNVDDTGDMENNFRRHSTRMVLEAHLSPQFSVG